GVAVEGRYLAHLIVEQVGDRAVERGVVGDDLLGGVAARLGRTVERLDDSLAQIGELRIQRVDGAADGGAVDEIAGQGLADLVHLVVRAVGVLAVFVELGARFRLDDGRPEQDVGGDAAFGVEIARNVADDPHDPEPALGYRDLVHGLVFGGG